MPQRSGLAGILLALLTVAAGQIAAAAWSGYGGSWGGAILTALIVAALFMRDIGDVVADVAMPAHVGDRLGGMVRCGFDSSIIV